LLDGSLQADVLTYKGWLPTVTGRLSYTFFGQTSHPSKANSTNVSDGNRRYICVYQTRKTSDAIVDLPQYEKKITFCFVAKTKDEDSDAQKYLEGYCYMFRPSRWSKIERRITCYQYLLNSARASFEHDPSVSLSSLVGQNVSYLHNQLVSESDFVCHARISRTGTTELTLNITTCLAPNQSEPISPAKALNLAAQCFYFLKDIGHHHQHHNRHTDTITSIHVISDRLEDVKWRTATLYNMYRKVIDYKRHPKNLNFNDCLGLLAYAEAFNKISREELPDKNKRGHLPKYYYRQVSESIRATQSKIERKIEEENSDADKRLNYLVAAFGLIIAYLGLMQFSSSKLDEPTNPYLIDAVGFMLAHPGFCIFGFLFVVFSGQIYNKLPLPQSFRDKYLRALASFPKIVPVLMLFLITVAAGFLIVWLFFGLPLWRVI
jgi:hypothetical protein